MNRTPIHTTLVIVFLLLGSSMRAAEVPVSFDGHLRQAQVFFNQKKFPEALAAIQAAGKLDTSRYEAPLLAAVVFVNGGHVTEARQSLAQARKLAPATALAKIDEIAKLIEKGAPATLVNEPKPPVTNLTGAARRKYDTLLLIVEEADKAKSPGERKKLLEEFLEKSGEFVREFRGVLPVWVLRAAAALELEREQVAWEASSELIRLGAEDSEDAKIRRLLATLDRKGWLRTPQQMAEWKASEERRMAEVKAAEERRMAEERAAEERKHTEVKAEREKWLMTFKDGWENSLGMRFVPVPGTDVFFSVWETRKRDYAAYAQANSGVDNSWQNPTSFLKPITAVSLTPDHPVVSVSWTNARNFCKWLTKKEQGEGKISNTAFYRLPTDAEWSHAVGIGSKETGRSPKDRSGKLDIYPWGAQLPPPNGAGNYADLTLIEHFKSVTNFITGYRDGFVTTAPVGSFAASPNGLHDLGGNVSEMCEDEYEPGSQYEWRVTRGGSWLTDQSRGMVSSFRGFLSQTRNTVGFRVVFVGGPVVNQGLNRPEP